MTQTSASAAPAPLRPAAALAVAGLAALFCACGDSDRPLFEEHAAAAGLDIPLVCGRVDKRTILEVNGNGVAFTDLDADGDLDVVLVDGSTSERFLAGETVTHHVLVNTGSQQGVPRFTPATGTGLEMQGWPTGIAAGDIDADGRPDLVIGGLGEDALFLNRTEAGGPIRFEKRALPGRTDRLDWTTSVGLADFDGDGKTDIYLVRYLWIDPADPPLGALVDASTGHRVPCRFKGHTVMCGPMGLPPQPDVLLRATDGAGAFDDVSVAAGLRAVPDAYGLGILCADLDTDGDVDVYVANDSVDNFVLLNRGDGTFADSSAFSGAASDFGGRAQAGMGVDLGALGGGPAFDIVVTNFSGETNTVYVSNRSGTAAYRDSTAATGLAEPSRRMLGWGVALADFDVDGRLDMFVSNGHVFPQADEPGTGTSYAQPSQLFLGTDGAHPSPFFGPNVFDDDRAHKGRSAVRGDLDNDGDLDLLVLTLDGAPLLYLNRSDVPERQLLVTLRDGNREAFGATMTLWVAAPSPSPADPPADRLQRRQVLSSSSFQASPDPRLHFSVQANDVGDVGPDIIMASVLWPGGKEEALDPATLSFGTRIVIEKGRGVVSTTSLAVAP